MSVPLLNRRSGLSIRYGVQLYKQLIHPMISYACPIWLFAASTHVGRLQVLSPSVFALLPVRPGNIGSTQINEDLGVPFLADHISHNREF